MASDFKNFKNFITNKYEPKKNNRFILYFETIPNMISGNTKKDVTEKDKSSLMLSLQKAARPSFKVAEETITRFNEPSFTASKAEYSTEMACEFMDYINNSPESTGAEVATALKLTGGATTADVKAFNETNGSSTKLLYGWYSTIYNPETGSMGYKTEYTTDALLYILDPHGAAVETWKLYNIFPTSVDFQTLSYENSTNLKINVTFKYDLPELVKQNSAYAAPYLSVATY